MKHILLVSLLVLLAACAGLGTEYIETDKIKVFFYDGGNGRLDDKAKIILTPERVRFSVRMAINHIKQVEVFDASPQVKCNRDEVLPSPSKLVSFKLAPEANIRTIEFHLRLPCAAYHRKFYIMVKVKALGGNYFMKKKLPILVDTRGLGG